MDELERAVVQAAMRAAELGEPMPTPLYRAIEALTFACRECNAGGHICPGCGGSVPHGQFACLNCDPLVDGASTTRVDGTEAHEAPRDPDYPGRIDNSESWVASTFLHIEKGDRLRIGQDEATVLEVSRLTWHAREGGWIEQRDPRGRVICKADGSPKVEREIIPWPHTELRADLGFGMTDFPTTTEVEILCTAERRAQLTMSEGGLR